MSEAVLNSEKSPSSSDSSGTAVVGTDGESKIPHVFNEQTNYVPKSTIITTATQLIVFRAFTGVGGGGLMTVAQMIVSDVVPLRERGKYQGILGAVVAIANGIGPVIGGALSSINEDSWRWIFRLNLPLTAITTLCVLFFMPLRKVTGDWKMKLKAIDFIGAFLALGSTAVLLLGLTWGGGEYPWASAHVIATIVVGFAVAVGFVIWQWKGDTYPLVPMHIFKSRIVNGACLTMFINGWNFLVQVYYIPTFYQLVFGHLSLIKILAVSSTVSGLVVHWVGRYRECILFGWMIWAVGLGLFSTLDESSGLGKQIGYGLLTGVGVGNTLQPSISSLGLTQSETRSFLSSPQNYLSKLPQAEAERARSLLIPAYQKGFRIIFLIGAALAAVAFVLAFWLMPQVTLNRADDEKLKEEGRKRVKGEGKCDEEVNEEERR
ncbi:unnamed protein product [Aspergillus oryzae]|nr:unnamed protein product [Aspergillus oryzae]